MLRLAFAFFASTLLGPLVAAAPAAAQHRARELGIVPGTLPPGPLNAITDVAGVRVGQTTVRLGDSVRTGVTAILPHPGNVFLDRVPAAIHVTPEAAAGGTIGKIRTGDIVRVDAQAGVLEVKVDDATLQSRKAPSESFASHHFGDVASCDRT